MTLGKKAISYVLSLCVVVWVLLVPTVVLAVDPAERPEDVPKLGPEYEGTEGKKHDTNHPPTVTLGYQPSNPVAGVPTLTDSKGNTDVVVVIRAIGNDPDQDPSTLEYKFEFWPGGSLPFVTNSRAVLTDKAQPGTYIVKVTVRDDKGLEASKEIIIILRDPDAPDAEFMAPGTIKGGSLKASSIRLDSGGPLVTVKRPISPTAGVVAGMELNIDRTGSDFRNFDLPSADPKLCQDACEKDPRCKAWTYVKPYTIQGPKPRCWLKDSVPAPGGNTSCISGVKGTAGPIRPGVTGPQQVAAVSGSDEEFVTSLYRAVLDREPDAGGLANWVNWLKRGQSREWVITQFFSSREYLSKGKTDREFVRDLYQGVLGREPDAGGWNQWVNSLRRGMSRQDCLNGFFQSAEYASIRQSRPPGVTQASIDQNKPWLDWRVQNCVRQYLQEVLRFANEEQDDKGEPRFSHIDEWGRLLRAPLPGGGGSISPVGRPDGNWDNPTHFVWAHFDTLQHRRSLVGSVRDYVRDCLQRNFGITPSPGVPGVPGGPAAPVPGAPGLPSSIDQNKPWLDWRVQNCVRQYLQEVLRFANEEQDDKGEPRFSHIDEWGRLLRAPLPGGGGSISPVGRPDGNWDNPTHFVWAHFDTLQHRRSLVGSVRDYVRDCLQRNFGITPSPGVPAAPTPDTVTAPDEPLGPEEWIVICDLRTSNVKIEVLYAIPGEEKKMAGPFSNEQKALQWVKRNCPSWRCDAFGRCFQVSSPDMISMFTDKEKDRTDDVTLRTEDDTYSGQGSTGTGTHEQMMDNIRQMSDEMSATVEEDRRHPPSPGSTGPSPPPPSKPPTQIGCDTTTKQGGNKPETFIVELGQTSGTFVFEYDMYNIPDQMIVQYNGSTLYDTGCVGNKQGAGKGKSSKPITYSGSSTKVTVKVLPSCEGGSTKWKFTANCPAKPPTQKPPSKEAFNWHSSLVCSGSEGPEYRWRWSVNLTRSGTHVSGSIYFHKCPGGGRVAYKLSGEIRKDGSFKVTGNKSGGRGSLYSSASNRLIFILYEGKPPNPNFAP